MTTDSLPHYTCPYPDCGRVSHHPQDLLHRYCGACHRYSEHLELPPEVQAYLEEVYPYFKEKTP
jgi:hypothetical protein